MARKRDRTASRETGFYRTLLWLTLCGAGVTGGILLGSIAVGNGLGSALERETSYAGLSGNPTAPATDGLPDLACLDCADSYGVAARLRTIRDRRSDNAFRELGAVELEYSPANEPTDDDYRYGGRFPDAVEPEMADQPPVVAVPAEETPAAIPTDDDPPMGDPQLPVRQD